MGKGFDGGRGFDRGVAGFPAGGGAGALQLVEDQTLAAAVTSLTFGTGVDGDTDEVYFLKYKIIKNTAAVMITTLRPNGATTNQLTIHDYAGIIGGVAAAGSPNTADLRIGNNGNGNGSIEEGHLWLSAKSGTRRLAHGRFTQSDAANTLLAVGTAMHWTDTAANIVSIDVVADQANGLGIGSYFRLYKLNKV